jgi:hypothetical protein
MLLLLLSPLRRRRSREMLEGLMENVKFIPGGKPSTLGLPVAVVTNYHFGPRNRESVRLKLQYYLLIITVFKHVIPQLIYITR